MRALRLLVNWVLLFVPIGIVLIILTLSGVDMGSNKEVLSGKMWFWE